MLGGSQPHSSVSLMLCPQSVGLRGGEGGSGRGGGPWLQSLGQGARAESVARHGWSQKPPLPADLGQRADEAGVLPRHEGHAPGAPPLRGQLRVGWRDREAHHARLLPQLLHESGGHATPLPGPASLGLGGRSLAIEDEAWVPGRGLVLTGLLPHLQSVVARGWVGLCGGWVGLCGGWVRLCGVCSRALSATLLPPELRHVCESLQQREHTALRARVQAERP